MNTYQMEIVSNQNVARDTYELTVYCPEGFFADFVPGQFVHILLPQARELTLRRPIGVHTLSDHTMSMVYRVVGKGTRLLSLCKTHDFLDILGPIGNGFSLPPQTKTVALVGGGLGVAPLLSVPAMLPEYEYVSFVGYQSSAAVYASTALENLCDKVHLCTDDGSVGFHGNAVQALEKYLTQQSVDVILSCGPVPMMKALQAVASRHGIPCQVSLEERMGCGYGACLTCVCPTRRADQPPQYERVCVDGPVFDCNEVVFE